MNHGKARLGPAVFIDLREPPLVRGIQYRPEFEQHQIRIPGDGNNVGQHVAGFQLGEFHHLHRTLVTNQMNADDRRARPINKFRRLSL